MVLPQNLGHLLLGSVHPIGADDGGVDHIHPVVAADGLAPEEPVLGGGEGHENCLVLVAEAAAAPLLHHTDDPKEQIVDADGLVDGVLVGVK